ncbi:hypothetical protein Hanom_Chr05g00403361 [Helianthus anomalus]
MTYTAKDQSSAPEDESFASVPEDQTTTDNLALMTQILSAPVHGLTKEEVISVFCTPECRERVETYRLHNAKLIQDYNDIKRKIFYLTKNEKFFKEKIKAQRKDIIQLKDDVSVKTAHYLEVKEKICVLTKELEEIKEKYQINEINIKNYESSSKLVKDLCDLQLAYKRKKGCGLGFNQVPPPYNNNYTYLPVTEEELMNEDKMTYGPKTDKSSINSRPVDKRVIPSINSVSKGTIDPNASSSCADEVTEVKCEDILGNEPDLTSDFSKNSINETESGCVFGQAFLNSFHSYVSSFGPDVLGKTVDACDEPLNNVSDDGCFSVVRSLRMHPVKPLKLLLKKINNVLILLLNRSQWTSLMLNLVVTLYENSQEAISEKEIKTETESSFQNVPDKIIKDEKHHQSESHACASSDQQVPICSEKAQVKQARKTKQAHSSKPNKSASAVKHQNFHTLKRKTCFKCAIED